VLALPADVQARIVEGRPLQKLMVGQIDYIPSTVTLHDDFEGTLKPWWTEAEAEHSEAKYFVDEKQMSGHIGRIFGDLNSTVILTVHTEGHEPLAIDERKIRWRTIWRHHYFSLWELFVARKFLPMFNGNGNLHYAGDWVYGVGHNDAILAGVSAACNVGISRKARTVGAEPLYSNLLGSVCRLKD